MRPTTLFLLLLVLFAGTRPCPAQPLPAVKPVTVVSPYVMDYIHRLSQRLALPDLRLTPAAEHFRLFTTAAVLDCGRTPAGEYHGQLVLWTEEAGTPDPTHRLYSRPYPLPAATVQRLFALADSARIRTLPSQEAIAQWKPTLDGVSYTLEQTGSQGHRVQDWANPQVQDSLPEALAVIHFVTRALALTERDWPQAGSAFWASVPYPCYSNNGGASTACRIAPAVPRTLRAKRKPHRVTASP
jgi:hypothetical protein